jgi:peptide/nickel transport system substrate-binding protein
MRSKLWRPFIYAFVLTMLVLGMAACSTTETVEVTRVVTQTETTEVTRVVVEEIEVEGETMEVTRIVEVEVPVEVTVEVMPEEPPPPTTFRIAVGIDPDTLDPVQGTTTTVGNMVEYMVETPLLTDKEGNVQPNLATEWDVTEDGLEYTLTFRDDVTFHDGTMLNAEAVKWNFDRLLDPDMQSPSRGTFNVIETVEIVDDYTIKLHLSAPYGPMLGVLSSNAIGISSPASVDQGENAYLNIVEPVGTGPYVFNERVAGERLVLTRYEDYWGELPYYSEVIFQVVPEAATRESLLLAGQADMIILPPISDIPALQLNPNVQVLLAPSLRIIFISLNNNDEMLSDVRVRQALNYAIDRQAIIDNVIFGAAEAMDAPIPQAEFGYCSQTPYEYDPAKARELLADAGAENIELNFISPTGRYVQDFQASQAVAGYLEEIGVESTVETMDWGSYVGALLTPPEENTLDLAFLGWAPSFPDPSEHVQFFESKNNVPNGLGTHFYSSPEVDELAVAAVQASDPAEREDLYCQVLELIWNDAPIIFLWVQQFPIVYSSDVTGVDYHPTEKWAAIYARPAG